MRNHDWERQLHDGGHIGAYEIWVCRGCGATGWGNPALRAPASGEQFYACGCGPDMTALAADCDDAKAWIVEHHKICVHSKAD